LSFDGICGIIILEKVESRTGWLQGTTANKDEDDFGRALYENPILAVFIDNWFALPAVSTPYTSAVKVRTITRFYGQVWKSESGRADIVFKGGWS